MEQQPRSCRMSSNRHAYLIQRETPRLGLRRPSAAMGTAASGLTRIGAILGTPLYMSPEQCRGERLDARSDIYSIGVIAYQMLTGAPPFTGDTSSVIRAHTVKLQPTPVRELNKKLPKRVSRMVMSALEKDREKRPPAAIALRTRCAQMPTAWGRFTGARSRFTANTFRSS